jgi:peptide/nickel transport system substrate-binding protein
MRRTVAPLALAAAAVTTLAACGGGSSADGSGGDDQVVDGGTFTMAINADPGNLDPHSSVASALFSVSQLPYDHVVNIDFEDGTIQSGLATEWEVEGTTVSMTLADGITCSDGTELTATDVAANFDYVADPQNKSPFLGTFLPVGATTEADDAAGTVTVTLTEPAPFVLQGLANIPIVCPSGLADRDSLNESSAGTGPYELTEAAPGDHYTYQIREGYTWGPDGATTDTEGMPDTIVMRIVQNESTAANLLVSGQLNGAVVSGPDRERLEASGLEAYETAILAGEQWYNQTEGRATSDADVRMALTQALDLAELQKVLTSGNGAPATTLAALDPVACPGDSVSEALPASDPEAAQQVLEAADLGELTFLFDPSSGAGVTAAAELAVQQWADAGVTVTPKGQNGSAIQQTVFGTGDWDIAWLPLNVNSPDQLVPFLSGAGVEDGGTNFAAIQNDDYEAGVEEAMTLVGEEGCSTWLEAESHLVAAADVIPFANNVGTTYQAGATFEYPGQMVPTSIRMLAN